MVAQRGHDDQAGTRGNDARRRFWDQVYVWAWGLLIAMAMVIVVIISAIVYGFLARSAPFVARIWAILATLVVPIACLVGVAIGVSLAERRIQWHDRDTDRALRWLAGGLLSAGVKASEVRLGTVRGLRDPRPGPVVPAFDFEALPPGDDRGMAELGAGEIIEV
jgi:uncharacterized membrane protein YhaH (DUF805 family)